MKLPRPACMALEKAINSLIDLDPESKTRLADLQGQVIRLHVTAPDLEFFCFLHADEIEIMADFDGDVDTSISGSAAALKAMRESSTALFAGDVELDGNIETAKKFNRYLDSLDIDWEEHLSHLIGDTAAYQSSLFLNRLKRFLDNANKSLQHNLAEYLTEEAELTAPESEVKRFAEDVDNLNMATDRLSARIAALEKKQGMRR